MEEKQPKTTDERLDALTMNLELMSHTVEANAASARLSDERIEALNRKTDQRFETVLTAIEKMLAIAQVHQRRLDAIEGH